MGPVLSWEDLQIFYLYVELPQVLSFLEDYLYTSPFNKESYTIYYIGLIKI